MPPENDYILVEDSKNMSDDTNTQDSDTNIENNEDSSRTLEAQGIFIEDTSKTGDTPTKHLDDFAQELLDQGGIEIVPSEDEDFV